MLTNSVQFYAQMEEADAAFSRSSDDDAISCFQAVMPNYNCQHHRTELSLNNADESAASAVCLPPHQLTDYSQTWSEYCQPNTQLYQHRNQDRETSLIMPQWTHEEPHNLAPLSSFTGDWVDNPVYIAQPQVVFSPYRAMNNVSCEDESYYQPQLEDSSKRLKSTRVNEAGYDTDKKNGDDNSLMVTASPSTIDDRKLRIKAKYAEGSPTLAEGQEVIFYPGFPQANMLEYQTDVETKPPFSYITLIVCAVMASEKKRATLSEIYSWIMLNFAFYRKNTRRWQNSIRHALSFNDCFTRVPRPLGETGKGSYWTLHAGAVGMFENSSSIRRNRKFVDKTRVKRSGAGRRSSKSRRRAAENGGLFVTLGVASDTTDSSGSISQSINQASNSLAPVIMDYLSINNNSTLKLQQGLNGETNFYYP